MEFRARLVLAVIAVSSGLRSTATGQENDFPPLNFLARVQRQPVEAKREPVVELEMPADAKEIVDRYRSDASEIRSEAEKEIARRREVLIQTLQTLQDKYTRDARLDEAVAIRDKIRELRVAHLNPRKNPGSMTRYRTKIGKTFYFKVVGSSQGSLWGSGVYTYDSSLAVAAVHAGVLKAGQSGIVKVTMVEAPDQFTGSTQNGVMSMDFGPFPAAFRVERPLPTDVDTNDPESIDDLSEPEPAIQVLGEGLRFLIPDF